MRQGSCQAPCRGHPIDPHLEPDTRAGGSTHSSPGLGTPATPCHERARKPENPLKELQTPSQFAIIIKHMGTRIRCGNQKMVDKQEVGFNESSWKNGHFSTCSTAK